MDTAATANLPLQLLQQGGFLAVLVAVLYFYRRDYQRLTHDYETSLKTVTDLVCKVTEAMGRNHELAERATSVMEQMANRRRRHDADDEPTNT